MTTVWCNNNYCTNNENGRCNQDEIHLSHEGQPKVFIFDCWTYNKDVVKAKNNPWDKINKGG